MTEDTLFQEALSRPAQERAAFLEQACAGRPELRAAVEALLAAHEWPSPIPVEPLFDSGQTVEHEPGTLDRGATGPHVPPPEEAPVPLVTTADYSPNVELGTVIAGRYTLLEVIGEGGMGTVYLAEQTAPVRRQVALKLIKAGMDSRPALARFDAERQALALMDHPNIARVFDGGATAAGQPFFVMELVRGVPLTVYGDQQRLPIRARLGLFTAVCRAVQHAHQKGIIHRDLKPSNILVTLVDGRPVPKVIDFGVAKAIAGRLTDESLSTQCGAVVGTLEYMAPEQAGLGDQDIDTRADIYSLGVILYELLTGLRPLHARHLKKVGFMEMIRILQQEEPPWPSDRFATDKAAPALAALRQTGPRKLAALLRGELDWVVMKCLEKQRDRRYETANGLARDLQRYLADEPVEARPPSMGYRLRKFLRRYKGPVSAAALVLVTLIAGITASTWLAVRATQAEAAEAGERKKAEEARSKAQAKEAEANTVVKFFEDNVFVAGRPKGEPGGLGHDVSLRDAIRASLPDLGKRFADQPLVEARLRLTLGNTLWMFADPAESAEQFERARALFTRHRGPDHPDTLESMSRVAASYLARNRVADAVQLYEETVAAMKRVLGPEHPDTLRTMERLAVSYSFLKRPAESIKLFEETLAAQKRVLPRDHRDTLTTMGDLAITYGRLHRVAESVALGEETLAALKRVLPPDNQETLATMNNLAPGYFSLNRPAEGVKLFEEVLAARRRTLPPGHPQTVSALNNLGRAYTMVGRHAEAQKLSLESQAGPKPVLPPDQAAPTPDAPSQRRRAVQHAWKGDWKAAAAAYARVFAVQPLQDGELGFEYAAVLLLSGDQAGYRKLCAEMLQRSGGPGVRPYHAARACTLAADSVKDAALAGRMAAVELRLAPREFWSLTEQGALAYRAGHLDEAATLLEQSLKADAKPGRSVLNWLWLALVEQRRGQPEKARAWLERATKWLKQCSGDAPPVADEATGLHLHNWLEAQVLRREAETLLGPKK